jgi:hypothetical protein
MAQHRLPRDEVEAALAARGELGRELEPEVVDAFLDRVERAIDRRVDERLEQRHVPQAPGWTAFALPVTSIALMIPISEEASVAAEIVAWVAIAIVNVAYALARRSR